MILDGKKVAADIKEELRQRILAENLKPTLCIIQVGQNPASCVYVRNKCTACYEIGIKVFLREFPEDVTEETLTTYIKVCNIDSAINGIIVQLPLPEHINETNVLCAIDPRKDVDGLTPENVGRTVQGLPSLISATPKGIQELLLRYGIDTEGKHAVVIGRSNLVGKPMALLLMQRPYLNLPGLSKAAIGDATVTICHSHTKDLAVICKTADIIVAAAGCPGLVTADMIKPGAIVIDVGINRVEDKAKKSGYRLVGDVDFEGAEKVASYITPVPGGVGPMTIAALLDNTVNACISQMLLREANSLINE